MSSSSFRCAYAIELGTMSKEEVYHRLYTVLDLGISLEDSPSLDELEDGVWDFQWRVTREKGKYYVYVDVVSANYLEGGWSYPVSLMKSDAQELADLFGLPVRDVRFVAAVHHNSCEWDITDHNVGSAKSVSELIHQYRRV